jgi:hypothetical protein
MNIIAADNFSFLKFIRDQQYPIRSDLMATLRNVGKQTVTFEIPDALYEDAKVVAKERKTTVRLMIRDYLHDLAKHAVSEENRKS